MYFLVGRYLPFKVLNIRIKKEQEEGWSLKCKTTNKTEVEGKCSSKIFDHSRFFTHLSQAYSRIYFLDFIDASITSKQLVKTFCFSRQKTQENTGICITHALVVWCLLLYNTCLKMVEFSRQKTKDKNTGAQNTHAPLFFFFKLWYFLPAIK